MIIRSQDKKHTTTDMNLEIVTKEYFPEFGDGDKTVESKIYNSVGLLLGTYSTEEKTIKVLDMICKTYQKCEDRKSGLRKIADTDFVFQMPQDSEV